MKILFISQDIPFPIYKDGLTVRLFHTIKELSKKHECHLISLATPPVTQDTQANLDELCQNILIDYHESKLRHYLKTITPKRFKSEEMSSAIKSFIQKQKPSLVIAEQTFMAQYVHSMGNTPKVMSAVDAISLAAFRQANSSNSILKRVLWKYIGLQRLYFENKYFKKFDRLTVVSAEDARFLKKYTRTAAEVIPNGVDLKYFAPSLVDAKASAITFTGNLSAPMNEEAALYLATEIYPKIHDEDPSIPLIIAGRSPSSTLVNKTPSYVKLLRDLPDLRHALSQTKLFVCPIIHGTGIKNNVLQALSMGIPTAATSLIAEPIGIKHNIDGFIYERSKYLYQEYLKAYRDTSKLSSISHNSRKLIEENFSWERTSSMYIKKETLTDS